jgi:23S rRNA pseudouridine1911/1915/1917 synthase
MDAGYKKRTVTVPQGIEPIRLDKYLASLTDLDLSRAFIQHIAGEGQITVDRKVAVKKHVLRGGETIVLTIPPPETPDLTPEDIPLEIVYDDGHLAVVNKPAGLVVHPAPGNPNHTLVNALLHHFGQLSHDIDELRPGIIHRLDKSTSGLLLVAKNDSVARKLRQQLSERRITKIYNAVICGRLTEESGTIELPIGRSLKDRKKMIVTNIKSREAITRYKLLERFRINDLVEVNLVTGRTHQIRVHFAHLNRPVLGDPDYGGRQKWLKGIGPSERNTGRELLELIDRQALHARKLEFTHPVTGKNISVECDLPDDMRRLIAALKEKYG